MDACDALPYDRLSVRETHPDHLAALARLFGIDSPHPATSRVLELGCAEGANLVPMAWYLPDARFVGLDLSERQVQAGRAHIATLGLDNIELLCADVADARLDDQGFDYIIAHGLYSWVPDNVRRALLDLVRAQLRPHGVAYLSFNALPGWHMRGMLREMLLFHVRAISAPLQRVSAARELLGFLETGLYGLEALSARYLLQEMAQLREAPDSYLYHEYLATVNEPLLFADFVANASAAGLRYLCNADLQYQFPASLGEGAEQALSGMYEPLQRQQYLDFLINRNFHQALLVRDDDNPLGEPDYEAFGSLAFYANLAPPARLDLRRTKPQPFSGPDGQHHPVSHPLTKAALAQLSMAYPQALAYDELGRIASDAVRSAGDNRLAGQLDHLFGELFYLFVNSAVGASVTAGGAASPPDEPWCANEFARFESAFNRLVDSRHYSLALDPDTRRVIEMLDGRHDHAALCGALPGQAGGAARALANLERLLTRHSVLRQHKPGAAC